MPAEVSRVGKGRGRRERTCTTACDYGDEAGDGEEGGCGDVGGHCMWIDLGVKPANSKYHFEIQID